MEAAFWPFYSFCPLVESITYLLSIPCPRPIPSLATIVFLSLKGHSRAKSVSNSFSYFQNSRLSDSQGRGRFFIWAKQVAPGLRFPDFQLMRLALGFPE